MSDVEQLEKEADELWRQTYAPDQAQSGQSDTAEAQQAQPEPTAVDSSSGTPGTVANQAHLDGGSGEVSWEERYKHAQANMTRATQEAAARRQEVEELRSAYHALSQQLAQANTVAQAQAQPPAQKQDTVPVGLDDDLQKAIDEDPVLAGPLVRHMQKIWQHQANADAWMRNQEQMAALWRFQEQQRMENEMRQHHSQIINSQHPDAYQISESEDFKAWIAAQPPAIQLIEKQGEAADVTWLLSYYKQAHGLASNISEARAAATPNVQRVRNHQLGTSPKFTREQIASMSRDEFIRRQDEIDAAIERGLVQ